MRGFCDTKASYSTLTHSTHSDQKLEFTGVQSPSRRIKRAFDARYDRDIKEITDEGEIIYKPRYDTKHAKRQRVPNRMYNRDVYV